MKTSNAVLLTSLASLAIALFIAAAIAVFVAVNVEPIPPWCAYCTHTPEVSWK